MSNIEQGPPTDAKNELASSNAGSVNPEVRLDTSVFTVAKDSLTIIAGAVAVVYVLGYICRQSAMSALGVGELAITRESAVLSGVVYLLLLAAAASPFLIYKFAYEAKINNENRKRFALLILVDVLIVPSIIFTLSGAVDRLDSIVSASAQVIFTGLIVCFIGGDLYDRIRKGSGYSRVTSFVPVFYLLLSVYSFGRIVLPALHVRYGGFSGDKVWVVTTGPLGSFSGSLVCEDSAWIVLRTRKEGSYSVFRVAKSDVKAIENEEPSEHIKKDAVIKGKK